MKRIIILTYIMAICILTSQAQVRIVNSAANSSLTNSPAFIDASSNSAVNNSPNVGKGLVFPQVDLSAMTAFPSVTAGIPTSFPTRFDGMIVYNTATSGVAGVGSTQGTLSPGFWYYENKSATNTGGTWKPLGGGFADGDTIIGNEVLNATAGGGLVRAGAGTSASPYTLGINTGGVATAMIADNAVSTAKIANNAVTVAKLPAGSGTATTYLNGAGTWTTPPNDNTTYTGSTSITLNTTGNSFERAALTGPVTAAANSNATAIANNAITTAMIANGAVSGTKIATTPSDSGKVLMSTGSSWVPTFVNSVKELDFTAPAALTTPITISWTKVYDATLNFPGSSVPVWYRIAAAGLQRGDLCIGGDGFAPNSIIRTDINYMYFYVLSGYSGGFNKVIRCYRPSA